MRISFRPVTPEDDDFLLAVYRSTREAELALVPWSEEQKSAFVLMQFKAQRQHYDADFPGAEHDIICADDTSVGRLYLARLADEFHLADITILPQFRGRGYGSLVLQPILQEARAAGKPVVIYVESFNPSLRLFRRLGFETAKEDGFLLQLRWLAK